MATAMMANTRDQRFGYCSATISRAILGSSLLQFAVVFENDSVEESESLSNRFSRPAPHDVRLNDAHGRGGAAAGMSVLEYENAPLREPSGHVLPVSFAINTTGHVGAQPQTMGTVSPCGGATPWLMRTHVKRVPEVHIFHAGVRCVVA